MYRCTTRTSQTVRECVGTRRTLGLGELMYQSHASYSRLGLGCRATDEIVRLAAELGPQRGLFGRLCTHSFNFQLNLSAKPPPRGRPPPPPLRPLFAYTVPVYLETLAASPSLAHLFTTALPLARALFSSR